MDLSLDPGALARLAAPYSGADGRESAGGNPAAFHLPLMDPGVSFTPDGGSNMSTDGGGAGGNTAPVFNQANFSFVSTPPAVLAEMMRQATQNQQLEGQRAELMLAAQRLRNEADEAFSEHEEMRVQAKLFITAAEAGYQTLQEQAQTQFMEMSMNHRQHIAGIEMVQSQKVSSLEMNLAQQQQASMDLQRRLTETESIQAQLLKELREMKQRKDDAPGVPEGAAELRESIPVHEVMVVVDRQEGEETILVEVVHQDRKEMVRRGEITDAAEEEVETVLEVQDAVERKNAQSLRKVATPFHEERIARPTVEGEEKPGVLAPIATRVLMKVLFAARMARFDLLRAVQGLAARVEADVMPTVRDRIAAWEKVSTDLRAACVKVAFGEDPEAHVRRLASIRQPIGVAIRGTLGGGSAQGSFGEIADLMERVPECLLAQLSSGPEGSADLLICGDSSFAVIRQKFIGPMIKPEITRMDLDYDLPKAYNRHLGEHYGYLISRGVPCVDPSTMTNQVFYHDQFHMIECYQTLKWGVAVYSGIATSAFRTFQVMQYKEEIEPLTILNAGEGEGDLQLMEFMFRYPIISEVRAAADLMLAGRRAVDQIELSPADIVDAVDQEIMNWLLQEEETDVVRLKDTSHVLAQEMTPDDLLRLPIDAEELDESEHDERHRIIMKELYPDLPTPMGGQELVEEFPWEVPDEGDTLDFDEWERALEEKKKNPDASSFIPPVEVPLPPPKTEEERADDEAFADVRTEKSYVIVEHPEEEQPDWDDDDADKPEPMEVDEKAQGEQKMADEEAAPEGQNDVDQPAEESQGGEAKETPGQAREEKTQTDDAQPMEIDLTGEDDAEEGKPKKKPSATKPQKPSVPEGSPKPELTELEKAAAEAKAHYEELSYVDEKTGRIVVKGEQEEGDARFKKWKEAERLAIRPKAQPKQVRHPNLEPTLRAIDTEDPSKDLEFAQLPGQEVWLGPEHLRQIPRRDVEWGRFRWISQELTSHLRGHKELKGFDTPDFEEDGSKPWKPLMECLQKRINQCREWEVLLVIKNSEDERFELKTRLSKSQASREGPPPVLTGFMLGQVCIIINEEMSGWAGKGESKGKSKGKKGKGKGKFRDITDEDLMANEIVQIPKRVCPSPLCATKHFDGQHKCDYCRQDLQVWSDARSASELARMEETANLNESVVALDQLSTRSFRKANVVKDTSKGEQQRGAKSAFGLVKRLAVNYVRKAKQLGLPGPTKRLEVDPLFAYNCATTQLTSGSLTFLHRLARAIFANPGRSALERKRALDDQEREHHSKLCFIPTIARDPNDAMSIEDESFVCHHNRFFNLKQFSMWCSLARTRNEPVVAVEGWGSLECVPEGDAVQILSDLVEFAERNWARACEGTEYSDTTIFSGRFPEVKLTERRSTAKESAKTAFDPRSKGVGKDAKLCYECGSPDHRARDCPEAKGRNKGKGKGKGKSQYQGGWQSSWNQGWGGSWGSGSWDWNRSGRSSWQSEAASSSSSDWWSSSKGGWWNR
ncbi:unnamed protein product [Durusdinium trenchii]|uniref:CCHC-type domain-containing protein n=1 Tax=Durusdinium trenchii TaxID=1381693 RepID=A0ABP0S5N4_9DINO